MSRKRKTDAERARERREKELARNIGLTIFVKAGKADHVFEDAETKAVFLARLEADACAIIEAEVSANPGIYKRHRDGTISLLPDDERKVIPLRDPEPPVAWS